MSDKCHNPVSVCANVHGTSPVAILYGKAQPTTAKKKKTLSLVIL